jgi:lipopolysaccharide/colanic/teichoic acid biosynthesis glycosyltransferase
LLWRHPKPAGVGDWSHESDRLEPRAEERVAPEEIDPGAATPLFFDRVKRGVDVALVLAALPVAALLALLVAIAVRIDSPGPVLFRQSRVGRFGRTFVMLKFRSMRNDPQPTGARFADVDDPRITRIGHFLRKTRLDEIPQLWNVLRGDMSLIGPRPEQIPFVEQFEAEIPRYGYRHVVRPGLTGWAQINQGYAASTEETRVKLEYDLYYVMRRSLALDFLVLARTVPTILRGSGAR